jgi:hypothetical protein
MKFLNGKNKGDHQKVNTCCKSRPVRVASLPVFNMFSTAELTCFAGFLYKTFLTCDTALSKETRWDVTNHQQ